MITIVKTTLYKRHNADTSSIVSTLLFKYYNLYLRNSKISNFHSAEAFMFIMPVLLSIQQANLPRPCSNVGRGALVVFQLAHTARPHGRLLLQAGKVVTPTQFHLILQVQPTIQHVLTHNYYFISHIR